MNDVIGLLNEINKIPEDDLIGRIVSYCEQNDLNPQEIGDQLSECEQFKRQLWMDAVRHKQIKDDGLYRKLKSTEDIDVW